jgi:predicted RNA binding protein YcfA (HicA-like mRNA interferase family)
MKRRDLIKLLVKNGWSLERSNGPHDIYRKGNEREPVPRHKEITENTAQAIIKRRGLV